MITIPHSTFFYFLTAQGLHFFNRKYEKQLAELVRFLDHVLLIAIFLCGIMVVVAPGGILYSTARIPLWQNILTLVEYPGIPIKAHVEQGIHWSTLLIYSFAARWLLITLESKGVKGIHQIGYTFLGIMALFVLPFEWIYTTLLDFFHNCYVEGWATTTYGLWRPFPSFLYNSVIGRNGFLALGGFLGAYCLGMDYYFYHKQQKIKLSLDSRFILYLGLYFLVMGLWVAAPALGVNNSPQSYYLEPQYLSTTWTLDNQTIYDSNPAHSWGNNSLDKGSKWFPQTIYVWYGQTPLSLKHGDKYDIVREEWHTNDWVKIFNTLSKLFSVIAMVHLLTPREAVKPEK